MSRQVERRDLFRLHLSATIVLAALFTQRVHAQQPGENLGLAKPAGWRFAENGPSLSGMKGTDKGAPTEPVVLVGYLDHFVLDVRLEKTGPAELSREGWQLAAWFGKAGENQVKAKFARQEERGAAYELRDDAGQLVPPEHPENGKAIPFHPEPSNRTAKRAGLSKGIGGDPIPLIAVSGATLRLYSTMHQRFSYSLVGLESKHFREFGARYSFEQLSKLKPAVYHLVMPFTAALVNGEGQVVDVQQGQRTLRLDLTAEKLEKTLESLKGSGAPLLPLEPSQTMRTP